MRSAIVTTLSTDEQNDLDPLAMGRAKFAELLETATPMAEFLWRSELNAKPIDTPERRADLETRIMAAVATIRDNTVRRQYYLFMRGKLRDLDARRESQDRPQQRIIRMLIEEPSLLDAEREAIEALAADDPEFAEAVEAIRRRQGR